MSALTETWKRLQSRQGGVWLPVLPPLGALVELAALVAVIQFADWVLPGIDAATLEPSPYWIPVLLLSLQYGTVAGLLAAVAATLAHILNGFPDQGIGENLFTYLLRIWALPILWIGVSLLVGQFRLRQIEVKQELQHKLTERTKERDSLASYSAGLQSRCTRLERDIATRTSSPTGVMLEALAHLDNPAADLASVLSAIARQAFPEGALSVFTATANGLDVIADSGWDKGTGWAGHIAAGQPLYRAIMAERRALSVLNRGDDLVLQAQGLAAQPVFGPDSGRVIGMVKLEHARPADIAPATLDRLEVIARLVAPRLAEPRIVVDNGERPSQITGAQSSRVAGGWRQISWRRTASPASAEDAAVSPAGRHDVLPRIQK